MTRFASGADECGFKDAKGAHGANRKVSQCQYWIHKDTYAARDLVLAAASWLWGSGGSFAVCLAQSDLLLPVDLSEDYA